MERRQDESFTAFEGNKWFERNKSALERFDPDTDFPLRLMDLYGLHPQNVLEIGAANGCRLAAIYERCDARAVAVEPSKDAILNGKNRFPNVEFVQGIACEIPLQERFELIIVNFVFHWIDRRNLLKSISEIDRLLDDKGFLIIGDFMPSNFIKVRYHHLPQSEIYTYKQNYAAVFLASGLYRAVAALTGHHGKSDLSTEVPEGERTSVCLLQKQISEQYTEFVNPKP